MTLHPKLADILRANREANRPRLSEGTPEEARALFSATTGVLGPGPEVGDVSEQVIPTRGGSIAARLFRPNTPDRGLVIYMHGGGWVLGALTESEALVRALVARSGCAFLLIDYRLAPEHRFPAGLEDVQDAVLWAASNQRNILGYEVPLVIAGDSAGANLATVTANAVKQQITIALQVLFYPVTDCEFSTQSYQKCGEGLFLTRAEMEWFFGHYADKALWRDPQISPLRSNSLGGAAPAWIATAEHDILRDEAEAYARKLAAAGVVVEIERYEGMGHGFARMLNIVDAADRAVTNCASAIRRYCSQAHQKS